MPVFRYQSTLPVPREEALAWHARPGALERLSPPWERLVVEARSGGVGEGGVAKLRVRGFRWEARHHDHPDGFADEMARGPFLRWEHAHRFVDRELIDEVRYRSAFPVRRLLERGFAWRHRRLAADLAAHHEFLVKPRLRVGITGASGLLGADLRHFLATGGHDVVALPRAPRELSALDAVVHLAGEPIGDRWTRGRKSRILESRREGTRIVAEAVAKAGVPTLVVASAIGYYGDRADEPLVEASAPGDDFLAGVCEAWERAAQPAREAGARVAHLRTGIVLSPKGGALKPMLLPFKLGAGGPIGPATQWMSWIAQDDWTYAAHRVLMDERAKGPVNLVAGAVRNREFVKTLGRVLRRPALAPLPTPAVKLLLGEMGEALLLESQRVEPRALEALGHRFAYPTLEGALRHEMGRAA